LIKDLVELIEKKENVLNTYLPKSFMEYAEEAGTDIDLVE